MAEPESTDREDEPDAREPESFAAPFFEDPNLRIILVCAVGIFATFMIWGVVMAVESRNPAAMAALGLFGLMSAEAIRLEIKRRRRVGPVGGLLLVGWALVGAGSWAAMHYGLL